MTPQRKYVGSLAGSVAVSIAAALVFVFVEWVSCDNRLDCRLSAWSPFTLVIIISLLIAAGVLGVVIWLLTRAAIALMRNPRPGLVFVASALLNLVLDTILSFALASWLEVGLNGQVVGAASIMGAAAILIALNWYRAARKPSAN